MSYLLAVIILGVLIFVHELGHFLLAKCCKVGVLEFAIGFGPRIISKKFGETSYSLRAIPLGGYVRMVGDDPRLAHTDTPEGTAAEALLTGENEPLDPETARLVADKSRWFLNQGLVGRSAIVLAGPMFNLGFALLLALVTVVVYGAGVPVTDAVIGGVMRDHPAERAGLKADDHVITIDGVAIQDWEQLAKTVATSEGRKLRFDIERAKEGAAVPEKLTLDVQGEPESVELALLTNNEPGKAYKIGISPKVERRPVALAEAPRIALQHIWNLSSTTVKGVWYMIRGSISSKNIAGPIYIFGEAASSTRKGLAYAFDFMILLSVSLAILNLLPIPVLDGGHLLFFLLEALRGGRPLSLRALQIANNIGLAMLLGLMVFALGNDLIREFLH